LKLQKTKCILFALAATSGILHDLGHKALESIGIWLFRNLTIS